MWEFIEILLDILDTKVLKEAAKPFLDSIQMIFSRMKLVKKMEKFFGKNYIGKNLF